MEWEGLFVREARMRSIMKAFPAYNWLFHAEHAMPCPRHVMGMA